MKRMDRLHPRPLPMPACFYREDETYPETIRASFTNGHVITYRAENRMPSPVLITERERERQFRENGGYLFSERKAGNSTRRPVGIIRMLLRRRQEDELARWG